MTIEGLEQSTYDPATGNYSPAKPVTRRIVWSRTSVGIVVMSPRDGFDLDFGLATTLHFSSFGELSQVGAQIGPRAELYLPLTDLLSLKMAYDLSMGFFGEEAYFDPSEDDSGAPIFTQSLSLGLDVAF
jgi:hypothetical protein